MVLLYRSSGGGYSVFSNFWFERRAFALINGLKTGLSQALKNNMALRETSGSTFLGVHKFCGLAVEVLSR